MASLINISSKSPIGTCGKPPETNVVSYKTRLMLESDIPVDVEKDQPIESSTMPISVTYPEEHLD